MQWIAMNILPVLHISEVG